MHQQEFRSRPLQVRLATSQGAKRTATNIVSRVARSPSVNGATEPPEVEMPTGERAARTLGLMNVPDTVNDARIRALTEPYGRLIKVILRPDHQGAIVEYADVNEAGKASLELGGQEIAPGRRIQVGTVPEMLRQRAERKGATLQPTTVRRPQQPGRGRRGGLGVKRGPATATATGNGNGGQTKSNDDFRTMMMQGRPGE